MNCDWEYKGCFKPFRQCARTFAHFNNLNHFFDIDTDTDTDMSGQFRSYQIISYKILCLAASRYPHTQQDWHSGSWLCR